MPGLNRNSIEVVQVQVGISLAMQRSRLGRFRYQSDRRTDSFRDVCRQLALNPWFSRRLINRPPKRASWTPVWAQNYPFDRVEVHIPRILSLSRPSNLPTLHCPLL